MPATRIGLGFAATFRTWGVGCGSELRSHVPRERSGRLQNAQGSGTQRVGSSGGEGPQAARRRPAGRTEAETAEGRDGAGTGAPPAGSSPAHGRGASATVPGLQVAPHERSR